MQVPTVVCRSCGQTAPHPPDDPMALCPSCGAALPATPEVLHARRELAHRRDRDASIPGVKKAEGLWVDGLAGAPGHPRDLPRTTTVRSGGGWLLLALLLAAAAAAFLLVTGVEAID